MQLIFPIAMYFWVMLAEKQAFQLVKLSMVHFMKQQELILDEQQENSVYTDARFVVGEVDESAINFGGASILVAG